MVRTHTNATVQRDQRGRCREGCGLIGDVDVDADVD
jgi:hypothetical protein